jgi:hypothetical protein
MTDVENKTVEINDAVFCAHFKEVVRRRPCSPPSFLNICVSTVHRLRRRLAGGERRFLRGAYDTTMMALRLPPRAPISDCITTSYTRMLWLVSSTLLIAKASRRPRRARTRITCISARNMARPVRPFRPLLKTLINLCFWRNCSMQSVLWVEEADHACARCG